ncbi:MAG: NAD(P)-dependent oxidoreductase [Rhodospirillaceae bacterium]|nr:NAD(P)-dependent oxidoreductase [Rhodospirillaceae bacterium]
MKFGFAGIGNMGAHMARNLAAAGFDVTVYDKAPGRAAAYGAEHRIAAAESFDDLADVDALITMLPTGADVRGLLLDEEGGLANRLKSGTLVIDMSSSEPVGTQELGAALGQLGIVLIDAPVSGGITGADKASLTIMIGGDDAAAMERATPALEAMGGNLFRTGKLGSGHAVKALNNYVAAANFAAASEAVIVGKRFGLEAETLLDVINVSSGRNSATEGMIKRQVLPETFAAGFSLALMAKDVRISRGLAEAMNAPAPMNAAVTDIWNAAEDELGGEADFTAAYKSLDK